MDRRSLLLFIGLSLAIMIGWTQFVMPVLAPPAAPRQVPRQAADDADPAVKPDAGDVARAPDVKPEGDAGVAPPDGEQQPPEAKPELERHPRRSVLIGSLDPGTGYFAAAGTTSTGAAVDHFTLNDPRYKVLRGPQGLNEPQEQLKVVQAVHVGSRTLRTLETAIPQIDAGLADFNTRLNDIEWEVAEKVADPRHKGVLTSVTYRHVSPDGKLEVRKKYSIDRVDAAGRKPRRVRDTETKGYALKFELTIINHDDAPQKAHYVMQGPVGLPLENIEHTHIYRSVRDGRFKDGQKGVPPADRGVELITVYAADVADKAKKGELDEWKNPFRYIGVDVQYFAALIVPQGDQLETPYFALAQPMLVEETANAKHSDVSVELTSSELTLQPQGQPGSQVTHEYVLFAGPKRDALLEPLAATDVIEYGWFGVVSRLMLAMMNFMHDVLYLPYGLAIIFLTIVVRGCMYPISRKQAAGAKKMKELQPQIAELKKKYGKDKEKFARAQMELFSKHNYNPLAGCLPIVLQLPIFIGLYQALQNAVDLRMTPFPLTWIDNLAAPDALFRLPFAIPFGLGQDFNLLPLLTVALFIVQQKLFMPPPADEQQALQHKMMNFMMIFMGFLFYHMPAGLCVYFIASSLWGIGERKMLDFGSPAPDAEKKTDEPAAEPTTQKKAKPQTDDDRPARKGFLQRLFDAADAAAHSSQSESHSNVRTEQNGRGSGKKRKKSRR